MSAPPDPPDPPAPPARFDPVGKYILNASGEPERCHDLLAWARWFETADRRICQDMDEGQEGGERVRVSTVFLGIDHNHFGLLGDAPILFETMVFGGPMNGEQWRYATREEAILGHQELCMKVSEAMKALQAQEPHQ